MDAESGVHSRTSSTTLIHTDDESSAHSQGHEPLFDWDLSEIKGSAGIVSVGVVALAAGYEFLAYLLFAVALYVARATKAAPDKLDTANLVSISPSSDTSVHLIPSGNKTLGALNELISAGNLWDSAVNEAMSIVEKDEQK